MGLYGLDLTAVKAYEIFANALHVPVEEVRLSDGK
jgi:hypothetical protein